jgi:hypothetical protein
MINSFVIYSFKENISIYQQIDETLEPLKNKGEIEQNYNPHLFWSWWKKKVEYQDEELSFLVVTDNKEFRLPDDIGIADKNSLSQNIINDLLLKLPSNSEVLTFPKIEDLEVDYTKVEESKDEELEIPMNMANPSLATFFRKKTNEMRG